MTVAASVDWAALALLGAAIIAAPSLYAWRAWRHGLEDLWPRLSPLAAPLGAVTLVMVLEYPGAVHRGFAAVRLLVWLGYVSGFALALLIPPDPIRRVAAWLAVGVVAVTFVEWVALGRRAGGLLTGNPNRAASLILALVWAGGVGWLGPVGLMATGSRGALLGFLAALVGGIEGKRLYWLALALGLILVGLLLSSLRVSTVENRLGTWQEAVELFLERPVTGWGPGCYQTLSENEVEHPHADSFPLTVAAEMGVLGLGAFGWLFFSVARLARGGDCSLGLLAWAVHNLVDDTLWWYPTGIVLAVTLAMAVMYDSDNSENTAT